MANVEVFDVGFRMVEEYSKYGDDLLASFKTYIKNYTRNFKRKGKFVEPDFRPPQRLSTRLTIGAGGAHETRNVQTDVDLASGCESPLSSTGRKRRKAAVKGREGWLENYKFMNATTKLRRPSNFDPKTGLTTQSVVDAPPKIFLGDLLLASLDVSKKPEDEDKGSDDNVPGEPSTTFVVPLDPRDSSSVFKKPAAPPVVAEPRKTERVSRAKSNRATRSTRQLQNSSSIAVSATESFVTIPEEPPSAENEVQELRRSSRSRASKWTLNSSKPPPVVDTLPPPAVVVNECDQEDAETTYEEKTNLEDNSTQLEESRSMKTRTKTLRKNKQVADSLVLNGTFCVAVAAENHQEPEPGAIKESSTPTKTPVRRSTRRVRSTSCPDVNDLAPKRRASDVEDRTDDHKPVEDPMDQLECGYEPLTKKKGSNKREHSGDKVNERSSVKRLKSSESEELNALIAPLLLETTAHRTRSKVKALAARSRSTENKTPGSGKENVSCPTNMLIKNLTERKNTPLAIRNKISPNSKTTSAPKHRIPRFIKDTPKEVEKPKIVETRKKEDEATRKKQELMLQKKEGIRKNRELKVKKVAESRAAVEKEKLLQLEREKKEREEKERQTKAEIMKQKEEALQKKKLLNMQKAQEAEERRQKEEQMRLARLKELEEEQRKNIEARQKQVEEAERLAALRRAQEKEEQMRLLEKAKERERLKALAKSAPVKPPSADPEDYGIDDDDEEDNKDSQRPVPKWVKKVDGTNTQLKKQAIADPNIVHTFFNVATRTPDLKAIFGSNATLRPRTSSAVWTTPPHL